MSMLKKVIVPLDGSLLAEQAIDAAAAIAERIVLVHAVTPAEWFAMPADELVARERKRSIAHLEKLAGPLRRRGIGAEALVRNGEPSKVVSELARREKAELIVMSSHGRTGTREWAFGSVAERTMRRSKVPVLAVRGRVRVPFTVKKILVPLDGSGREARSLGLVRAIAGTCSSEVVFLHVPPHPKGALKQAARESVGNDRFLIREGEPAETILRVMREEEADLLALTVAPKMEGDYVMFGRVAERILREIDRPVILAKG